MSALASIVLAISCLVDPADPAEKPRAENLETAKTPFASRLAERARAYRFPWSTPAPAPDGIALSRLGEEKLMVVEGTVIVHAPFARVGEVLTDFGAYDMLLGHFYDKVAIRFRTADRALLVLRRPGGESEEVAITTDVTRGGSRLVYRLTLVQPNGELESRELLLIAEEGADPETAVVYFVEARDAMPVEAERQEQLRQLYLTMLALRLKAERPDLTEAPFQGNLAKAEERLLPLSAPEAFARW